MLFVIMEGTKLWKVVSLHVSSRLVSSSPLSSLPLLSFLAITHMQLHQESFFRDKNRTKLWLFSAPLSTLTLPHYLEFKYVSSLPILKNSDATKQD